MEKESRIDNLLDITSEFKTGHFFKGKNSGGQGPGGNGNNGNNGKKK